MMVKRQVNENIDFQSPVTFLDGYLNVNQQHHDPNDRSETAPATIAGISESSGNSGLCF